MILTLLPGILLMSMSHAAGLDTLVTTSELGPPRYFYRGLNYGSEAAYNPLTTVINEGFSIVQIGNRSNKIADLRLSHGFNNVAQSLCHPINTINAYGWWNFLKHEVIPTGIGVEDSQFVPNYLLHLIGGGATFRAFQEWYNVHEFRYPKAWAFSSWVTYVLLNETVEGNWRSTASVDPIADVYFFNPLGALLFSSDRVAGFFADTIEMRDWSSMPAYDPVLRTIENVGQNFMVRYDMQFWQPWSLFYHFGLHGILGLSYELAEGRSVSIGGGIRAKDLYIVDKDRNSRRLTTTMMWTGGVFYDLHGSLLSSLILGGTKGYDAKLNVYPGLLFSRDLPLGLFANLRNDGALVAGIVITSFPFGLAQRLQTGL